MEGVEVVGLQCDEQKQRLTGVRIRNRRSGSAHHDSHPVYTAELIVDALGRRSQTPEWLVEMGFHAPKESEVDSFLGYVTRKYKRNPDSPMLLIGATPPQDPYAGLIFSEENDTMVAMIAGYNKKYPPIDPVEFDAFTHVLGPEFQEALRDAEPLSQPYGFRGTSSRWRHYEQLDRWPECFVVLGDAFCGFNPIYGQGMSVPARSAAALFFEGGQTGGADARWPGGGAAGRQGGSTEVVRTALVRAPAVEPLDPTGCGDVFGATCCARLLAGDRLEAAVAAANAAAARNATYRGATGLAGFLRGELVGA